MNITTIGLLGFLLGIAQVSAVETNQLSQYGITWTFDKAYPVGQFCSGDYWVVGPVTVIGITTDLHAPGFAPQPGEDGAMVNPNPGTSEKQGYDYRIFSSYDEKLNAALIGGKPISPLNPLLLATNSSLVSMVSWLFHSEQDAEPGVTEFYNMANIVHAPRSATRTGAILTVLPKAPPPGCFRPPYAGCDKTVRFNFHDLDLSKLKNLPPVASTPDVARLEKAMARPWIDHVIGWLGAEVHPTDNMPNYGGSMALVTGQIPLLLQLDFSKLPGKPTKDKLLVGLVQFGIDCAGIADAGGSWPADGGHAFGRKEPILFAGALLNDAHMQNVGHWNTLFQEDEQTFYVTQKEVDLTHSPQWKPDQRMGVSEPYAKENIGMPEWGIRHAATPSVDDRAILNNYRPLNSQHYPGMVLAMRLMGLEEAWNHKAFFDYTDRWMKLKLPQGIAVTDDFYHNMWNTYGVHAVTENR